MWVAVSVHDFQMFDPSVPLALRALDTNLFTPEILRAVALTHWAYESRAPMNPEQFERAKGLCQRHHAYKIRG
jgi:hypothetical protein